MGRIVGIMLGAGLILGPAFTAVLCEDWSSYPPAAGHMYYNPHLRSPGQRGQPVR